MRQHASYWAFVVHRVSGIALALFLPLHFWSLGRALHLEDFVSWTQEPLVKAISAMPAELLASKPPRNMTGDPNETVGSNLATFVFHESYHVGQTGVLRRVAGKPGVIKPPGR